MRSLAVVWRSADLLMAIDSASIVEVLPPVSCRAAPGTPSWVRGLFVYRGALIPMVDATCLLTASRRADRQANRVIVIRMAEPMDWSVGFWVESVLEIERIDFGAAGGHPGFATQTGRFLGPVARTARGQVQLVRPQELFTPDQIQVMTQRFTEAAA